MKAIILFQPASAFLVKYNYRQNTQRAI